MDATNWRKVFTPMIDTALLTSFPDVNFAEGKTFSWSPRKQVVYYDPLHINTEHGALALLHEIGHARLNHSNYQLDIELINMEVAAWNEARKIAKKQKIKVDEEHIEACLETYRVWLFKRSRCPECNNASIQQNQRTYRCFLCGTSWQVAQTKTTQPRRMRCLEFGI